MQNVLFASGNLHKIHEVNAITAPLGLSVVSAAHLAGIPHVDEDGETFEHNAAKKAVAYARGTGCPTLADDSGLVVPALDGKPGVRSARYAGENATDRDNLMKLLNELQGITNRTACFVCVIACASPRGDLIDTATGNLHGRIIEQARGTNGFGYDPVFVPDGLDQTLAELTSKQKNQLSHRAEALRQAHAQGLFDHLLQAGT